MFGDKAVAGFIADGINVDYVVRDRTSPSGVALIFVGQNGENSIAVASGANAKLSPADCQEGQERFGEPACRPSTGNAARDGEAAANQFATRRLDDGKRVKFSTSVPDSWSGRHAFQRHHAGSASSE